MSALFRGAALAVMAGGAILTHVARAQNSDRPRTRFQEMSFVLPAGDWRREKGSPEEMQVIFSRVGAPGRDQTLSVSRVEYGVERYALSPAEHTALIFDMERDKRRPQGSWSGWNRSERVIGDRKYPVMTYQVAYPAGSPPKVIADAIFALYFPADFASREQFYVFNWIDTHLAGETAAGPAELDTILASFAAEPRKSAPQVVTYTIGTSGSKVFTASLAAFRDVGFPRTAMDTTIRALTSGVLVFGPRQKLGEVSIGDMVDCGKDLGISRTNKGNTMLMLTEAVRVSGDSTRILMQLMSGNHDDTAIFGRADRDCTSKGKLEKLVFDRIVAHVSDG